MAAQIVIFKPSYFPVICAAYLVIATIFGTTIAIFRGDISPRFTHISNGIGSPPQSGIVGVPFVLGAWGLATISITMYFVVKNTLNETSFWLYRYINMLGVLNAICSSLGFIIVAVNPVRITTVTGDWYYPVLMPHVVGAILVFWCGISNFHCSSLLLPVVLQVYKIPTRILYLRILISILAPIICFIENVTFVPPKTTGIPRFLIRHHPRYSQDILIEDTYDEMISMYVSTLCEWLLLLISMTYVATWYYEFSDIVIKIEVSAIDSSDESHK